MKTLKRILRVLAICAVTAAICAGIFSAGAVSDDPADSYVKQDAPYEDSSIKLWFDYSFRKTLTSDTKSTGMDTFSIYMGKNEIESAQFVLYSDTQRTNLLAEVTDFTDGNGNTLPAQIYYQMYVTVSDVNSKTVWGTNNIIKEGETPDPVMEISRLGTTTKPAYFKLNAGKSQAFLIRATSSEDTPAGWYSAQLNIKNEQGQIIKTATVYCHVWDFVISDETRMQTAFYMGNQTQYGGTYQEFYDYLLENRLNAMDLPGGVVTSDNPYLTNPRVTAIRVSGVGGGTANTYSDTQSVQISKYPSIYNDLSSSPAWEQIKDKLYFYSVDEPLPYPLVGGNRQTVDDVKSFYSLVQSKWGDDIRFLVTPCEDFPYSARDKYYTKPIDQYAQEEIKDADQEMIDTNTVQIFCPRVYAFTPYSELQTYGRILARENVDCIRGESITSYSGCYGTAGTAVVGNFDWNAMYGDTFDRYMSHIVSENSKGTYGEEYEMWMYSAGINKSYTYTNHVIENTGLQTKLLFWQAYQCDVNGYLYYGVNNWNESGGTTVELDKTVTGSRTGSWPVNKYSISVPDPDTGTVSTKYIYGNGVLFYGPRNGKTTKGVIGSLRVELLRDSVEEYQMLTMLEDLKGKDRAKEIVSQVSTNVVRYLSLSGFDRSAWSSSMDEYDIMETVRRQLGNELEAATLEGECEHTWNGGTVAKAETCTAMGEMLYTCTACGAQRTEYIPTKHEVGTCFTVVSGTDATCTEDGAKVMQCTICGFKKTVTTTAFHNDSKCYAYTSKGANGHSVACAYCSAAISSLEAHTSFNRTTAATCTEGGNVRSVCSLCGYAEVLSTTEATGHNFVDGYCTVCGEPDPDAPSYIAGDVDADGKLTAKDINILKRVLTGKESEVPAADVNGDGKLTTADVSALKRILVS
ncbi:MAG: dockerin type I repeat-containing protein [Clostridia bacterium]|nr:dockerin type I repeat-containing protein [Clostridia bacterium]